MIRGQVLIYSHSLPPYKAASFPDFLDSLSPFSSALETDASTKTICPDGDSPIVITDVMCPGGTGRMGMFNEMITLAAGCCYVITDPGPDGMGADGDYVNALTSNTYQCSYRLSVSGAYQGQDIASFPLGK